MSNRRTRTQKARAVNRSHGDYRDYYSYTSEAYKLHPETYTSRTKSRKKTKRGGHVREKAKRMITYRFYLDEAPSLSLGMYFSIVSVFALCFCLIYVSAQTTNMNARKTDLVSQIKNVKDDIEYMKDEIIYNIDDERILAHATKNLGMHEPFDYQVVHIKVPVLNKTYQYASAPEKKTFTIDKVSLLNTIVGIGD